MYRHIKYCYFIWWKYVVYVIVLMDKQIAKKKRKNPCVSFLTELQFLQELTGDTYVV